MYVLDQSIYLFLTSFDDMRVTVAHMANIVDAVEELFIALVVHVLAAGSHHLQRVYKVIS